MKGVILAGGKSKRMGQDKALIYVGGESLIFHVYKAFKHQVNEVIISGPQDYNCLLYTSPSPRDATLSRMPSSA